MIFASIFPAQLTALRATGLVIAVLIQAWSLVHKTPLSFLAAEGGDIAVSPTPLPKKGGGS